MVLSIILATLAVVFIVEGLIAVLFTKQVIKSFMEIKKKKLLRKLGGFELIVGIIILIIVIILKSI